jgi:uncharacterized membrane protein YfcA
MLIEPSALVLVATGAATGLLGAMLGLGGGVFLVPLLTLGLGVPIRVAIAASLISVMSTAVASATVNLERGLVNMRLGLLLEVATATGALTGGIVAAQLTQRQLFLIFAVTMASMGLLMARRSGRRNVIEDVDTDVGRLGGRLQEGEKTYAYRVRNLPVGLVASLAAGAISGLLGLGGGIVKVPVLNTFCGIPIRVAAATSTFMIGVTTAASAFLYYARGDVALHLTAAVALGALPGSLVGARLSDRVATRALKVLMAVVLMAVGARMALEGR